MTTDRTDVTPTCVNHPGVETRLTCSSCGDPICPRCMVTTAVGQKCPSCARQSRQAKGTPPAALVARAFGAGLVAAALGGYLLLHVPFAGLLLTAAYGFLVGVVVRWAARRRTHAYLGWAAAAAVVLGLGGAAVLLGAPFLAPGLLLSYLVGGGLAFVKASGVW